MSRYLIETLEADGEGGVVWLGLLGVPSAADALASVLAGLAHGVRGIRAVPCDGDGNPTGEPAIVAEVNLDVIEEHANASGCQGHPAGPHDPPGETVFCDGSCRGVQLGGKMARANMIDLHRKCADYAAEQPGYVCGPDCPVSPPVQLGGEVLAVLARIARN